MKFKINDKVCVPYTENVEILEYFDNLMYADNIKVDELYFVIREIDYSKNFVLLHGFPFVLKIDEIELTN